MKRCGGCDTTKPTSEFHRHRGTQDGFQTQCKECSLRHHRRWVKANPERARGYEHTPERKVARRDWKLRDRYGVEPGEYEELIAAGCAICGTDQDLQVDHDHETGVVRGALCGPCNRGIGALGDDPERVQAAADYLVAHTHETANS